MLAIDTNVLVRYLTGGHPQQSARAKALVEGHDVFVPATVLLETEWVLRSVYGFRPARVADRLTAFAGLPRVRLENPPLTAKALAWAKQGMDFTDALHLAAAEDCEAIASFDTEFVRAARELGAAARLP